MPGLSAALHHADSSVTLCICKNTKKCLAIVSRLKVHGGRFARRTCSVRLVLDTIEKNAEKLARFACGHDYSAAFCGICSIADRNHSTPRCSGLAAAISAR